MAKSKGKGGALASSPKRVRLSPGVYRSESGKLVGAGGRPLPQQPRQELPGFAGAVNQTLANALPQRSPAEAIQAMGQTEQAMDRMAGQMGMSNRPTGPLTPEQIQAMTGAVSGTMQNMQGYPTKFAPMPQATPEQLAAAGFGASANQGGKYRLSPGVYGTQEQAQRAYQQMMAQRLPEIAAGVQPFQPLPLDRTNPNGINELDPFDKTRQAADFAQNKFNRMKDNNLFRGNPLKKFGW